MVRSLGLHGKKPALFLARWPSDKAMQHARDRIRDLTARSRLRLWPELIADDLNRFLRGWAAHFRFRRPLRKDQPLRADAAGPVHQDS